MIYIMNNDFIRDNERLSLNICKTVLGYAQRLSQNLNERFTKTL